MGVSNLSFHYSLGIKLELNFLNHPEWQELFQNFENPLLEIARLGLETVEFSLKPEFRKDDVERIVGESLKAGLKANFHPYTEGKHNPASFEDKEGNPAREIASQSLELCQWASQLQGKRTVLVLHGASTAKIEDPSLRKRDKEFFKERTNQFFKWMERYTIEKKLNVLVVPELQIPPSEEDNFFRIGDSFSELLETIKGTELGICWDTGHGYFAHLRKSQSLFPPGDFMEKIRHVHLHDVRGGEDHQPILAGTIPLAEYLKLLDESGFSGDITLELSPQAIASFGNFREVMANCLRKIRENLPCCAQT